jgi:hypothetical protein
VRDNNNITYQIWYATQQRAKTVLDSRTIKVGSLYQEPQLHITKVDLLAEYLGKIQYKFVKTMIEQSSQAVAILIYNREVAWSNPGRDTNCLHWGPCFLSPGECWSEADRLQPNPLNLIEVDYSFKSLDPK